MVFKTLKALKTLRINMFSNKLGTHKENMQYMSEGLKYLSGLETLDLYLGLNSLGENPLNMEEFS